jgi:hypothetical protein
MALNTMNDTYGPKPMELFASEETKNARFKALNPLRTSMAFPNGQHTPTQTPQRASRSPITCRISLDFCHPVIAPACRESAGPTGVHVPEAAVDEDDFFESREDQVRRTGQRGDEQSVAEAEGVDDSAANVRACRDRLECHR